MWKFASCDGCQLTLLNCEDELLDLAGEVEIAYFLEATRAVVEGPYDLSLVEGSVTTAEDARADPAGPRELAAAGDDRRVRHRGRHPGTAQLRRRRRVQRPIVYAHPEYIETLARSTPIAAHVPVDFELRGCPIDRAPAARGARRLPPAAQAADLRRERLHGVQAPRQRLRHGRPRHPLPRSRHPRRLRRALSGVRPRLLRLLRARRDTTNTASLADRLSSSA